MGRKRNQGRARRAAKAKAREEANERNNNNQTVNLSEQSLSATAQMRQDPIGEGGEKCRHGLHDSYDPSVSTDIADFVAEFNVSFLEAARCDRPLPECLVAARIATVEEHSAVWNDLAKMEMAMSVFLFSGTRQYLVGGYDYARVIAAFVRYFEQFIAFELKQTQALIHWPKIDEMFAADLHTVVKFYRHRIPCSCLDEKYEEVKRITMIGGCYNPGCNFPDGKVERSKTKYCSRCRCATYCSRECQEADWSRHKPICDKNAAIIAKFEAKQQNM